MPMGKYAERAGALVWMWTGAAVILGLVIIYGTIYGTLDLLWKLMGQDGFGSASTIEPITVGIYWWIAFAEFALLGRPGYEWVPDLS